MTRRHIYRAKNVGVVYLPDEHRMHNIGAVVFEKLNDLETITFEDEGTYWKARFVSKQYGQELYPGIIEKVAVLLFKIAYTPQRINVIFTISRVGY